MSTLAVTNTFRNGERITAAIFNTNYDDIVTYVNDRNTAAATWDGMRSESTTTVPLTANQTGTADIVNLKDNGTTVFQVKDGGIVTMASYIYARTYLASNNVRTSFASAKVAFDTPTQTTQLFNNAGVATIASAGLYMAIANVAVFPSVSNTSFTLNLFKGVVGSSSSSNISRTVTRKVSGVSIQTTRMVEMLSLAQNETLTLEIASNGAGYTVVGGTQLTYFSLLKVA